MLGCGSAGKFYFLSLLVNRISWHRGFDVLSNGNNKLHRDNEALKQLGFAFCLT